MHSRTLRLGMGQNLWKTLLWRYWNKDGSCWMPLIECVRGRSRCTLKQLTYFTRASNVLVKWLSGSFFLQGN